jgi:small subunit ribosomal protein S14
MAKKSMVEREKKRLKIAERFKEKRAALKAIIERPESTVQQRFEAQLALQKLPRDASPFRQRRRCLLTGRPRGYYGRFGLCRNKFRELAQKGEIPGVTKSSW